MKKNTDKVSQAYFDELGTSFGNKVRKRVHWILENAKGESVLDVGCSQGIVSILLGREGKDVIGIDVLKDAIDYANEQLDGEEEPTKKHVKFINDNFMDYQSESTFDVIIMGEIIEHLADPERYIEKAQSLLKDRGKLIVTVPFGVNDYFDHKQTFYLAGLLSFSNYGLNPIVTEYMGKWIGIVFEKTADGNNFTDVPIEEIRRLEKAFEKLERDYIQKLHNQKEVLNESQEKEYKGQLEDKNTEIDELQDDISDLERQLELEKSQILQLKRELFEQQEKEKQALEELIKTNNRYESLKKSKLGQLTVKYWQWKKNRR